MMKWLCAMVGWDCSDQYTCISKEVYKWFLGDVFSSNHQVLKKDSGLDRGGGYSVF